MSQTVKEITSTICLRQVIPLRDTNQTHVRNVVDFFALPAINRTLVRRTTNLREASPMNNSQRPVTLTPRGRLVLGLVMSFFVLLAWITVGGGTADASADQADQVNHVVVVQPGESLWAIATDIAPENDPREVIMRIRDLNDLGTQHVYPGQSLVVPSF